jgi:hypothetical protein
VGAQPRAGRFCPTAARRVDAARDVCRRCLTRRTHRSYDCARFGTGPTPWARRRPPPRPPARRDPPPVATAAITVAVALAFAWALTPAGARAQTPGAEATQEPGPGVYLVTFGAGEAICEKFGHNGIWIRDP